MIIWEALGGRAGELCDIAISGEGSLPSIFAVTDLAAAAIGVAGGALAELIATSSAGSTVVHVDRRLASMWYATSLRPIGWSVPPPWDPIAGDYATADGWIRLHTNAPHHREVALSVLNVEADKETVARAVSAWRGEHLESQIVARGGCAAAMRSAAEWQTHPQGTAVAAEPLVDMRISGSASPSGLKVRRERPLSGVRVLDLTRVLAGPIATRFLAGFGADVLRIDPPFWDEPAVAAEVTLGKRCARLDLRDRDARDLFERLLSEADVVVHSYRADALERLGLGAGRRRHLRPGLVDVSLDAYGWTGPWQKRRGFDSLVQMSSGIAEAGMRASGKDRPVPLPVQALDHTAGYLLAASAIKGLTRRLQSGEGCTAHTSLARIAHLLRQMPSLQVDGGLLAETEADLSARIEETAWGPARRLKPPLTIEGTPMFWDFPASPLGSSPPHW